MPKYNEIHLFKHVLLKYILKVFPVYYAIKVVTTCLYDEVKMNIVQNSKFYKNIKFIYSNKSEGFYHVGYINYYEMLTHVENANKSFLGPALKPAGPLRNP